MIKAIPKPILGGTPSQIDLEAMKATQIRVLACLECTNPFAIEPEDYEWEHQGNVKITRLDCPSCEARLELNCLLIANTYDLWLRSVKEEIRGLVRITRSTSDVRLRRNVVYRVEQDGRVLSRSNNQSMTVWKKFPAGKMTILANAWTDKNTGALVIGKVVEEK